MIPVAFAGCAGWLHPGSGARGVVLCPTIGHENMTAHRGWIVLAERLAARGFHVLRFDYPGTGDSAGTESDPDRLAAWQASILEAVRHLRETTDADAVILIGLRLGATLALRAAGAIERVDGVVCLAPLLSGRSYVRELTLLAQTWRAVNLLPEGPQSGEFLDVVGDRLTGQTLAELSGLTMEGLQVRAGHVLLMQENAGRLAADLVTSLEAQGCRVSQHAFPGAADYLQDGLASKVPHLAIDMITRWCEQLPTTATADIPARPASRSADALLLVPGATEQPFLFGRSGGLVGILCAPAAEPDRTRPTVIMLNTGFGRHIGDGRVFVTLARRLAALGVASLRMDLEGFGDSAASCEGDPDPYASRNADDVLAAVAALQAAGYANPVLVGICSGAYTAFHAALREPQVRAMILVNLQRFVWRAEASFKVENRRQRRPLRFYLHAATRRAAWLRLARGEVAVGAILMALCRRPVAGLYRRLADALERTTGLATRSGQIMRWFKALDLREVQVNLLYSDGDPGLSELAHYFGRRFKRFLGMSNARIRLLSAADHALLDHDARQQFLDEVCRIVKDFDFSGPTQTATQADHPGSAEPFFDRSFVQQPPCMKATPSPRS